MHSGFKGVRLGLTALNIKDNVINYEISYIDTEGVMHGTMRHSRALVEGSEINTKVDELAGLLLAEAAQMHFDAPAGDVVRSPARGIRGIAEALGDAGVPSDEPDGTPG
jgi:hypothetical protein